MSTKELSNRIDNALIHLAEKYGHKLLESSIGLIYLWFGVLKLFPGYSPAEALAGDTLTLITFGLFSQKELLTSLAIWEIGIGILLVLKVRTRFVIWMLLIHMLGTLTPILLFPELVFATPPFGFTMVGQYIMKNIVIISAALVLYSRRQ